MTNNHSTAGQDSPPVVQAVDRARLVEEAAPLGVSEGYVNAKGEWVESPDATLELALRSFGTRKPRGLGEPLVCTPGRYHPQLHGTLILESGSHFRCEGVVEQPGYHILYDDHGTRRFVIAAPEFLPVPERSWGWQIQLYSSRSRDSWGIGDFRDLALICRIAAKQGAGCVQCSPVHAVAPSPHPQDSPYSPASRNYLNLLHIAPGIAPGAERVDLSKLSAEGRALNAERNIDRSKVRAIKREAMRLIWAAVRDDLPLEYRKWRDEQGKFLRRFAIWSALVVKLEEPDWRNWPEEYRRPDTAAVRQFGEENADLVEYYSWCQWVADIQYADACSSGVDVLADLAVGFDANSEDAWSFQDLLAFDFEIGAPPDTHNTEGQRWGLPPFNPQKLTRVDFSPFIAMVDAGLKHAGALRIDHVMQLWRLYWVPVKDSATNGVYVYYPVDALLAILRVEAHRHHAWIVGEDMGTVAEGVRETMASIGMLGNRSAMRTNVNDFPYLGVGTSQTHDQVTIAGLLTGSDVKDLKKIGKNADFEQVERTRRSLAELAHIDPDKPLWAITEHDIHDAVIERYRLLNSAASLVVVVSLEDAAMVPNRPNMPGTIDQYPNWKLALPQPVDTLMDSQLSRDLVAMMNESRGPRVHLG